MPCREENQSIELTGSLTVEYRQDGLDIDAQKSAMVAG
jgi:hypothetical protein